GRDRALANATVTIVGIDEIPIEIDDRCKVEINAEGGEGAALGQSIVARRSLTRAALGKRCDHRCERRLPRQGWRYAGNGPALLTRRDREGRRALTRARALPRRDLAADGIHR